MHAGTGPPASARRGAHPTPKFDAGISMIEEMYTMWGVPAPGLTAPLSAIIEIGAGAALIAGIGTRLAALALSAVMVGALIYVKADLGVISSEPMPGAELDLALLAGLVAVVVLGPGRHSIDSMVGIEPAHTHDHHDHGVMAGVSYAPSHRNHHLVGAHVSIDAACAPTASADAVGQ